MISRRTLVAEQMIEGRTLSGYAAIYDAPSRPISEHGRRFVERIERGAFDASLAGDVKLYYNHDASMPLARSRSGTLTLASDSRGLKFNASLPETSLGNDVRTLIERGDLSGEMSFGFFVEEDAWSKDRTERSVKRAKLVEISIVQDAAYPQTTSALRGANDDYTGAAMLRLALHFRRMTDHV